jgi:hypothetical protein
MNYNVVTYFAYFLIILFVVLYVGGRLYRHGEAFVDNCFLGDIKISRAVNKFLLSGYYLMNIGYSIFVLSGWEKVNSLVNMLEVTAYRSGTIILMLGIMHYINIISLIAIGRKRDHTTIHQSNH